MKVFELLGSLFVGLGIGVAIGLVLWGLGLLGRRR
jgi:hypothetical protein